MNGSGAAAEVVLFVECDYIERCGNMFFSLFCMCSIVKSLEIAYFAIKMLSVRYINIFF